MISPTRPRSTASGLQMTRVRFTAGAGYRGRRSVGRSRASSGPGRRPTTYSEPVTTSVAGRRQPAPGPGSSGRRPRCRPPAPARPRAARRLGDRRGRAAPAATAPCTPPRSRTPAGAQRLEHGARVAALEHADHERSCRPPTANSSRAPRPARCGAGHVVGPVEHDQRCAARRPRAARARAPRPGPLDHLVVERRAEERLGRGQRAGRVVALVGAVQRQEHLVVAAPRGAQVDQPAAHRQPVATQSKSTPAHPASRPRRLVGRGGRRRASSGSVSPTTTRQPGLMMPAFSRGDVAPGSARGPRCGRSSTLVTTATSGSTTLVASQRPPSPTSTTATSTGAVGEPRKAAAVSSSNRVGALGRAAARARPGTPSTSASSSSSMGSPLRARRSLTRARWGLV